MIRSGAGLAETFVKLRQTKPSHQMQLIDRQRPFERRLLVAIVPRDAVRLGQVHPDGRFGWIAAHRRRQIADGSIDLALLQGIQPELVQLIRIGVAQGLSAQ